MSDISIKVENLGKLYRIGAQQERYRYLRETIVSNIKRLTAKRTSQSANDTIWALKDVSFEIKQGECLGIIGRNGAGKSTLLKVLSHITEPTRGRVSLYGRVGCLL
jgi:lipopolysaccharide transport system ATP-binding protein